MASPTLQRPGRILAILLLIIVVLGLTAFWPGQDHSVKLGLDLRGGTEFILVPKLSTGEGQVSSEQLDQTVSIIRSRVDSFGVAEATVTTQGTGSGTAIVVSIPGTISNAVREALTSTAKLTFRPVLKEDFGSPQVTPTPTTTPTPTATPTSTPTPSSTTKVSPSPSTSGNGRALSSALRAASATPTPKATIPVATPPVATPSSVAKVPSPRPPIQSKTDDAKLEAAYLALDCSTKGALAGGKPEDPAQYMVTCSKDGQFKYMLSPAVILGTDISSAGASIPAGGAGGWQVDLGFTSDGAKKFATATSELSKNQPPQNQFAIVLDGLVTSAPRVNEAILGGQAQITGSFTAEEAKALASTLRFGSLPITLEVAALNQVSPTLGDDQLRAGIIAGILGLVLVMLYLLVYYRALGVIAVISLALAGLITYFAFIILGRTIGFTLTLAGIAGAIVSIGITADSFVVYFERVRDEVREGRTLRAAADAGWIRARRTILAADFVSFLGAVVLYFLSVGNVRGFAFTLGLTTLIDVLVAFMFTHPLVTLAARSKWFSKGGRMSGVDPARLGAKPNVGPATRRPARTTATVSKEA